MTFEYYYKEKLNEEEEWGDTNKWDLFISSYNSSERVSVVFDKVNATKKYWLVVPEYDYAKNEYPASGNVFTSEKYEESEYINEFFENCANDVKDLSVCVDITGFMRPQLLYLILYLHQRGVKKFDVIYSEPGQYKDKEKTKFTNSPVYEVRPVKGYEGVHSISSQNDLLVIGVGYDHELVKQIVDNKDYAHIATLWGFPSLRADMYQENILRASKAGDAVFYGDWHNYRYYAMANDPFSTASKLREIIEIHNKKKTITNLFLSPLSTKPQVLGFALFYLFDWIGKEASIIFPFSKSYSRETSVGISKIWKYTIEFP